MDVGEILFFRNFVSYVRYERWQRKKNGENIKGPFFFGTNVGKSKCIAVYWIIAIWMFNQDISDKYKYEAVNLCSAFDFERVCISKCREEW